VIEKSFHGADNNNNENFNGMLCKVCPKATFAGKRGKYSWVVSYAAVSKNVGRASASHQVLAELSSIPVSTAAEQWGMKADMKRAYGKEYQAQPAAKKRRLELKQLKKVVGNSGNDEYNMGVSLHDT
jgi:hypothetical protein